MAFNITSSVATFSGQDHLNRTSNNLPNALERPAPDVKNRDHAKGRDTTPDLPAPDIKINFSSKGREAALNQPALDVKISSAAKESETKSEQPKPDAKGNRRTEELTGRLASKPQQTQSSELPTVIKETTKAIKQVQAGEGAVKEVTDIALKNVPVPSVSPNQKTGTSEVKATPAAKIELTLSKPLTEVKKPQVAPSTTPISTAPKTVTSGVTLTDAPKQSASNVPATNQANEAAKTEATTKAFDLAPLQSGATSQTAKPSSSQAINFGQILLNYRGIGPSTDKLTSAASNLASTLTAFKGLETRLRETLGATSTSTISNEQPSAESEKTTTDTKKPSLFFQGGANAYQIAKTLLDQTRPAALKGSAASSLSNLGANTLESNANNLRARLGNLVSAESTIRDSAFAAEIAAFTKNQVLLQANKTVLGNANQIPQLVADLLRG